MAPLPSNTTAVLFVDYSTGSENHTLQVRYGTGGSTAGAMDFVDAFLTALDDTIFTMTILAARVRDIGTNVTYPVTWTGASTYGAGVAAHDQSAWYIDFVGRSIGGRRVRLAVFGAAAVSDSAGHDYRLPATGNIADALTQIELSSDFPVAIDGDPAGWHQYANMGVNAYWRNRIR